MKLHKDRNKIYIDRGVRKRDTVWPKLFNAALERIFRRLDWDGKGNNTDSDHLSALLMILFLSQTMQKN